MQLRAALPVFRPFLQLIGVDVSKLKDPLNDIAQRKREFDALVNTNRFNELFAARGWVAYDRLNTEVAQTAISAADAGNMESAEDILVQYYTADQVAIQLRTLIGLSSFRPRICLAELALIDYCEGRYHSCVPVILALLDGMVNELGNQGFFSQNVDLTAWDSIAACNGGINELKTLLFKPRNKTTEATIELPYRNGIHHGIDLGYNNRMVAAKCWAALFATADWACRVEQGKENAPEPRPEPTWGEVVNLIQENTDANARLQQWHPRNLDVIPDPPNSDPESPEAALIEFLDAWRKRKYGVMAKRTHPFAHGTLKARAGEVRSYYKDLRLDQFTIEKIVDTAPAATEITVRGCGLQCGTLFDASGTFRLVNFDAQQYPVTHGTPGGTWFIMSWNPSQTSKSENALEPPDTL